MQPQAQTLIYTLIHTLIHSLVLYSFTHSHSHTHSHTHTYSHRMDADKGLKAFVPCQLGVSLEDGFEDRYIERDASNKE